MSLFCCWLRIVLFFWIFYINNANSSYFQHTITMSSVPICMKKILFLSTKFICDKPNTTHRVLLFLTSRSLIECTFSLCDRLYVVGLYTLLKKRWNIYCRQARRYSFIQRFNLTIFEKPHIKIILYSTFEKIMPLPTT